MSEVAAGIDHVADKLLESGGVWKAAVTLAVPDEAIATRDGEDPAGCGHERDLAEIGPEGREQFLRHPAGPQQPLALSAVGDPDVGTGRFAQAALSLANVASSTSKLA